MLILYLGHCEAGVQVGMCDFFSVDMFNLEELVNFVAVFLMF